MHPSPADVVRNSPRDHARRCRGQALIEFAFVMPVTLLLLLGIIDFGRAYVGGIALEGAAREGWWIRFRIGPGSWTRFPSSCLACSSTNGAMNSFYAADICASVGADVPLRRWVATLDLCEDRNGRWSGRLGRAQRHEQPARRQRIFGCTGAVCRYRPQGIYAFASRRPKTRSAVSTRSSTCCAVIGVERAPARSGVRMIPLPSIAR
jgi:TadE-like protein